MQSELLLHDCYEHIDRNSSPDLCLDGVLTGAIEGLYPEVLLDPFKEQLYLPSASVQFCYHQSGDEKVI